MNMPLFTTVVVVIIGIIGGSIGFYLGMRRRAKKTIRNKFILRFRTLLGASCIGLLLGGLALVIYSIKLGPASSNGPLFVAIGGPMMLASGFLAFFTAKIELGRLEKS